MELRNGLIEILDPQQIARCGQKSEQIASDTKLRSTRAEVKLPKLFFITDALFGCLQCRQQTQQRSRYLPMSIKEGENSTFLIRFVFVASSTTQDTIGRFVTNSQQKPEKSESCSALVALPSSFDRLLFEENGALIFTGPCHVHIVRRVVIGTEIVQRFCGGTCRYLR
jgi:hypothetical protein